MLADEEINIELINTSPIKITCLIRSGSVASAVRALHGAFGLGEGDIQAEDGLGGQPR